MFSPVQIKQEYTGVEDANQSGMNGVPGSSDYPVFTNQDVEYMYRQLPQFWGQAQLHQNQIPVDIPSKESLARQDIPQMAVSIRSLRQYHYKAAVLRSARNLMICSIRISLKFFCIFTIQTFRQFGDSHSIQFTSYSLPLEFSVSNAHW